MDLEKVYSGPTPPIHQVATRQDGIYRTMQDSWMVNFIPLHFYSIYFGKLREPISSMKFLKILKITGEKHLYFCKLLEIIAFFHDYLRFSGMSGVQTL